MGQNSMLAVCEMSQSKGYSHFFYGAAPEVPVLLAEKLKAEFSKTECGWRFFTTFSAPHTEGR